MLRRSRPSQGGTETSGTCVPIGVDSGIGVGVASALGSAGPRLRRGGRIGRALLLVLADEDAAAGQRIEGEHVVAGDHDVAAGHDQHDRRQAREGDGIARQPGSAQSSVARHRVGVEEFRDAVRIDDRDEAVEQRHEVEDEDRRQQERAEQQRDDLDPIHPQQEAGDQRDEEHRRRGEAQGSRRGARVQMTESRKQEGEERRSEGRPGARSRLLRFLHRA